MCGVKICNNVAVLQETTDSFKYSRMKLRPSLKMAPDSSTVLIQGGSGTFFLQRWFG